jgi:NDP-sugar pyrophosphorylase family protein
MTPDFEPRKRRRAEGGEAAGLRAVILAGGKGTRLKPFTINFPKPLVPLGDKPVLEVLIERLLAFGIEDITLTLGHLAELLKAYFQHRRHLKERITLRYVEEDEPTGTAGSLASVPGLDQTFLVMNGDLLTDIDFDALVKYHREQRAALTVATHTRRVKIDLGVLEFDREHLIRAYTEKPEMNYNVSMGIYVYEPRVLGFIEPGRYLDFPSLVHRLLERGERVCAFSTDCLWLDIGRPDDYAKAQELYAREEAEENSREEERV